MARRRNPGAAASTTPVMKINLSPSPFHLQDASETKVGEGFAGIGERRRIDEAIVKVTRHAEASPPWEIFIHLVTPGPDLTATTRDHPLAAAFSENPVGVEEILDSRGAKRAGRPQDKGPSKPPSSCIVS